MNGSHGSAWVIQLSPTDPDQISLNHAIRWMTLGIPPLSLNDELAAGDHVDISTQKFDKSRHDLILALRHGQLEATGLVVVFEQRTIQQQHEGWNTFLAPYQNRLQQTSSEGAITELLAPIPKALWDIRFMSASCLLLMSTEETPETGIPVAIEASTPVCALHCSSGLTGCFINSPVISFTKLKKLFSQASPTGDELDPREKTTLYRLIAGMLSQKYDLDPSSPESISKATAKVSNDLHSTGITISEPTVRKHLKIASKRLTGNANR